MVLYNRQRRHSALAYLSPATFDERLLTDPVARTDTVHEIRGNPTIHVVGTR